MNAKFLQAMPDDLDKRIRELAQKKGMNRTALINQVMSEYVGMSDLQTANATIEKIELLKRLKSKLEKINEELREEEKED
jgi:L-lactate utilization protein LutC